MPTGKSSAPQDIYQIKVTLLDTEPPVWRRLLVPAAITLEQLHHVLQAAMGWDDSRLHEFRLGRQRFGQPDPVSDSMGAQPMTSERNMSVADLLGNSGTKLTYLYDFDDDWEHAIAFEKRLPADTNTPLPACIGGERACPPQDCGGIGGFYALLEALSDPGHEAHELVLDWIGEFDPEAFSQDMVTQRLAALQRPRTKAAKY